LKHNLLPRHCNQFLYRDVWKMSADVPWILCAAAMFYYMNNPCSNYSNFKSVFLILSMHTDLSLTLLHWSPICNSVKHRSQTVTSSYIQILIKELKHANKDSSVPHNRIYTRKYNTQGSSSRWISLIALWYYLTLPYETLNWREFR
jgi:hypothetical protein